MPDLPEIAYLLFRTYKNYFRHFQFFRIYSNVNRQKTTKFTHFEAPGMLKTAPACIFHHNWYGKTYISMIFDRIYCIWHHKCIILYHICIPPPLDPGYAGEVAASAPAPGFHIYGDIYACILWFLKNTLIIWRPINAVTVINTLQ